MRLAPHDVACWHCLHSTRNRIYAPIGRPDRGGATVLKVGGGQILRAERAENFFFDPPLFGQWGGQNIAYIDKSA